MKFLKTFINLFLSLHSLTLLSCTLVHSIGTLQATSIPNFDLNVDVTAPGHITTLTFKNIEYDMNFSTPIEFIITTNIEMPKSFADLTASESV